MKKVTRNVLLLLALSLIAVGHFSDATEAQGNTGTVDGLEGTNWWVEDLEGKGVVDASHTTIGFPKKGKVVGDSGCNRYSGRYRVDGQKLSFGPMAGTRMACPEALMNQEGSLYQAISLVTDWEIADTGLLHLKDSEGSTLIRAWRIEEGET